MSVGTAMPGSDICEVCSSNIEMMARKGTGICSENCEKIKNGEPVPQHIEGEQGHHASE